MIISCHPKASLISRPQVNVWGQLYDHEWGSGDQEVVHGVSW